MLPRPASSSGLDRCVTTMRGILCHRHRPGGVGSLAQGAANMAHRLAFAIALVGLSAMLHAAQEPTKEAVEGIRNFTNVDPTVACAGATEVRAIPELARRGYKGIINLRLASEEGADIDASRAA